MENTRELAKRVVQGRELKRQKRAAAAAALDNGDSNVPAKKLKVSRKEMANQADDIPLDELDIANAMQELIDKQKNKPTEELLQVNIGKFTVFSFWLYFHAKFA